MGRLAAYIRLTRLHQSQRAETFKDTPKSRRRAVTLSLPSYQILYRDRDKAMARPVFRLPSARPTSPPHSAHRTGQSVTPYPYLKTHSLLHTGPTKAGIMRKWQVWPLSF